MINPADRPPSQSWEPLALPIGAGVPVWAWFKPPAAPQGVIVRIPAAARQAWGGMFTLRMVLLALRLAPGQLQSWNILGLTYDSQQGASPLLDYPLPSSPLGADLDITLFLQTTGAAPVAFSSGTAPAAVAAAPAAGSPQSDRLLAAMDADWSAVQQMEGALGQLRKQLNAIQGRLQSLSRDLTPDEKVASDSNDKKDWQDARRWLRDVAGQVSRYIREHDLGVTSAAGQRNRFEDLYANYVAPRKPFDGLPAAQQELEAYRKAVQSLVSKMQTALSAAGKDGEQRAQQILSRIGAKMRSARQKRGS
jgi:Skp family chaperone for outer membrane proteins